MNNNVHSDAKVGKNTVIGPFATIENDVFIGENCVIGPNAVIHSGSRIGDCVKIYAGAVVGGDPQDLKFAGEYSILEIGDGTIIREFCTLNRGTIASGKTTIGKKCLLMAYVHVAHDCVLGDHVILANAVNLAGHVEIGDYAVLGGMTAVHQFVHIGMHTMIGGGSLVRKDVPPYITAAREPLSYVGVNSTGLNRRSFSNEQINSIQEAYKTLYYTNQNVQLAVSKIKTQFNGNDDVNAIIRFVEESQRGIIRGESKKGD